MPPPPPVPTTQRLLPFAVAARKYGSKIAPAAAPKAASSSKAIKPGPEATNALVKRMRETRLLRLMQELLPDLVDEAKEKLTAKQQPQPAIDVQSSEEDEDNAPPAAPDDMDGSSDLDINSSTTISQLSPAAQAVAMSMIEMLREIKRSKGDFKMTEYQIVGAALMALDPVAAARSSDVMDTGDDDQEPQQTATDDMEYNLCCDGTGVGKTATMLLAAVWRARQTKSTPPGSIVTVLPTPVYRASLICSPNSEVMEQSYLMARRMGVRQSEMAIYPPVKGKPSTPFANCLLVFTTHSCVSNEFAFAPFLYDPAARNTVRAADVSASTANEALKATLEWRAKAAKRVEDGKREPSLLFPSSLDAYADDAPKIWNSVFYDEIHIVGGGVAKKRSSDPNKQPEEVVLERASKRAFVSARTLRKLCSRMYGMTASPLGNTVMDTPVICALCANRSRTTGHNPLIRRTFFTPGVSEQLALIGISAPTPPNVIRVSVLIPEGPEEQTMSKIEESLISALQDQRELSAKGDQGGIGQTMKMMVKADTATMSLMQHAEGASDSPDTKKIVSSVEGAVMDQAVKYVNKSTAIRVPGAKMRPIVVAASYKEHMNRLAYLIELYKEQGKLPGFLTHAIYHGELSPSARQEMLNAYNNGDINVLILSTNIGRVGLNLQGPDPLAIIIASSMPWTASTLEQLVSRVVRASKRIATVDSVDVVYVCALHVVSAWQRVVTERKESLTNKQFSEDQYYTHSGHTLEGYEDHTSMRGIRGIIRELNTLREKRKAARMAQARGASADGGPRFVVVSEPVQICNIALPVAGRQSHAADADAEEPAAKRQRTE